MKSVYLLLVFFAFGLTSCLDAYIPVKNLDAAIIEQVASKYPSVSILSVKKICDNSTNSYEVKLINGVKLKSNERNEIVSIDESNKRKESPIIIPAATAIE